MCLSGISVGTPDGFRVFSCDPFVNIFHQSMLLNLTYSSSLLLSFFFSLNLFIDRMLMLMLMLDELIDELLGET